MGFSVINTLFTDSEKKSAYLCKDWFMDIYIIKGINSSISVAINIVNIILKYILIFLISSIGEDTRSAVQRSIKVGIFFSQFFNTGILLMLSSANFKETKVPILNSFDQGLYTDFTEEWYRDVGVIIVKTMAIASVMPVIEFFMMWGLKYAFRLFDRSFSRDIFKSRKRSI